MIKPKYIFIALVMFTTQASAQSASYFSSFGDEFLLSTNEDGGVLRSVYPKAWFVEAGAESRIEKGNDVIYLGKNCDSYHKLFGKGTWGWANGGFRVDFENTNIGFARQEIDIGNGMGCRF